MTDEKNDPRGLDDLDWDQALAEWESHTFVPEVARDVLTDRPAALAGATVSKPLYKPPSTPPPTRTVPASPVARRPPPIDPAPLAGDDEDATLIAEIPAELLRPEEVPARSSRGGLGQLFGRDAVDPTPPRAPAFSMFPSETVNLDALFNPPSAARAQQLTLPAEEEVGGAGWGDAAEARGDIGIDSRPTAPPPVGGGGQALTHPAPASLSTPDADDNLDVDDSRREVFARRSSPPRAGAPGLGGNLTPAPPTSAPSRMWHDEKPASAWLDESARLAAEARAAWLEEEARALPDANERARGLLACSEILATVANRDRAYALAVEARELAPSLALSYPQARGLIAWPPDPEDYLESLEAEVKTTPAISARVHAALLAAQALRARGDDDAADAVLDEATRLDGTDVRARVTRVAWALGRGDTTIATLGSQSAEFAPFAAAIATCLRLRDVGDERAAESADGLARSPSESVLRARRALESGRLGEAAHSVAELARVQGLSGGARWLAAALGAPSAHHRREAAAWLQELIDDGDDDARRILLARSIELGDRERVAEFVAAKGTLTAPERVALAALCGLPLLASDSHLDEAASGEGMAPLVCAVAAVATPPDRDRAARTAGSPHSRAELTLGRLMASLGDTPTLVTALAAVGDRELAVPRGIALELAARQGRFGEVSLTIQALGASAERPDAALAAALVAERAHDVPSAIAAYKAERVADPTCEAALRALASLEPVDLVSEMNALADHFDDLRGSLARIEAVTRGEDVLAEPTREHLLDRAHRAAPGLPIASFLAERIARRSGDVDDVLRWIRERRATSPDAVEVALDSVREALLVADREPELASERLRQAHLVRPRDVALRDLYERMAIDPPEDRAAWREQRAAEASGDGRVLLSLEAAHEYERVGDDEGALRCATAAAVTETSLGCIARERAELRTGKVGRLADELLASAKGAADVRSRREAYERLAILDATARKDGASALLWHRSILEDVPDWKPSLRYLEQELIGEGRDEELEPVAGAIARSLGGTLPGEGTAHAELAARLRMRGRPGSWELTREMMDLAASGNDPSLWTLRVLQSRARATSDDAAFVAVTKRLVDRSTRPTESASLLFRAGQAALRLDRVDEARTLLERATVQDPGDVLQWELLARVKARAGDPRGAAEAYESLARTSRVAGHRLSAFYEAGRLWLDEATDEGRAISAFEAAAALDVTYADVFDRLAPLYAARRLPSELADLLERRLERIDDPEARLAAEVQRGQLLLEAGEVAGARRAFEAALSKRPDDPAALTAFADLCLGQGDWESAEHALVRLARLLPTAEEQRHVYARLGELYSTRLLNLSRAEVALKEVLKRAPEDNDTSEKLVEIYKRQNDSARAVQTQEELLARAQSPAEKRKRVLELAILHERTARDPRRAEKTLEAARREAPQDIALLRALAEFYTRNHQAPAVNILLDRAAADARRSLASGRFHSGPFEVIATVFELRGKSDAARTVREVLSAAFGGPSVLHGAGPRAFDPAWDDLLAPEMLTPSLRSLLARTGEMLDAAFPIDLADLRASQLSPEAPIARLALRAAATIGLRGLQVFSSPRLRAGCFPVGSDPPSIIVDEALGDQVGAFLVFRALKLVAAKASVLGRVAPTDLSVLVCAWLKCFNPTWQPKGVLEPTLTAAQARLEAVMPRTFEPDVCVLALEAAGGLDVGHALLGARALEWANRVALVALGDPNAALDSIAHASGTVSGAPREAMARAAWMDRTAQAHDLVTFAISEAFVLARSRLEIEG